MSRTLKVTGNRVMYDRRAWFLKVIMSSSHSLCCLPSVKKQKHDFHFFRSMYNKTIIGFGFCDIQNNNNNNVSVKVIRLSLRLRLIPLPRHWFFWISQKTPSNTCLFNYNFLWLDIGMKKIAVVYRGKVMTFVSRCSHLAGESRRFDC